MIQGTGILRSLSACVIGIALLGVSTSWADDKKAKPSSGSSEEGGFVTEKRKDGTTIKYKKKTTYDFEGTNVEGLYNKPSGSYISNIKDVKAKTIMRIRKNFDAEVIDSARMVK
jgi:hypothetical protein